MSQQTLTLQDLTDEWAALDALVGMDEGEWTDEHEALMVDLTEKMLKKTDSFGDFVVDRRARAALLKAEEKRLKERRERFEAEVARLEHYALMCLQRIDRDKLVGTRHTVSLKKNPPAVQITDPDTLLSDPVAMTMGFVRIVPEQRELDKRKIGDALKAGQEIPGCSLTQGFRVEVK